MADAPKLCKDCRHYRASDTLAYHDVCARVEPKIEPVRGGTITLYCADERRMIGTEHCGEEGKHWEAK